MTPLRTKPVSQWVSCYLDDVLQYDLPLLGWRDIAKVHSFEVERAIDFVNATPSYRIKSSSLTEVDYFVGDEFAGGEV